MLYISKIIMFYEAYNYFQYASVISASELLGLERCFWRTKSRKRFKKKRKINLIPK